MVKNGQACGAEGLSEQSIFGVDYANPKFPKLGIESLCLSELLKRVSPSHFASPQRPGFHLLMLFTAGSGNHFLDFSSVRCKPVSLFMPVPFRFSNSSLAKNWKRTSSCSRRNSFCP